MDYLIEIGKRIKEKRTSLGISQQELAEAVGYTQKGMISQIENGKVNVSMDKAIAIADYLGMKPHELFKRDFAPDRTLPPGGFHGGSTRPDIIPVIESLKELNPTDIARVKAYINALRSIREWQQLNGTEKDGDTESQSTVKLGLTLQALPDEEAELKFSQLQNENQNSHPSNPL